MAERATSLLVLGGARSGKSGFAQSCVEASAASRHLTPVFVATAEARDDEMRDRIAAHVAERDARWRTADAPYDLVAAIEGWADPDHILLVDCLTLWLTNIMLRGDDVDDAGLALASCVGGLRGPCVFVSNEVGGGIVPENALARRFRDAQGRLNQRIAAACERVVLVTAGLPFALKPPSASVDQL